MDSTNGRTDRLPVPLLPDGKLPEPPAGQGQGIYFVYVPAPAPPAPPPSGGPTITELVFVIAVMGLGVALYSMGHPATATVVGIIGGCGYAAVKILKRLRRRA